MVYTGISLSASTVGQKCVAISITDTGFSIPQEDLKKLFGHLFSAKDMSQATKLGFSVSFGIIQRRGEIIRVQSEVGRGSIFIIWLPVAKQS